MRHLRRVSNTILLSRAFRLYRVESTFIKWILPHVSDCIEVAQQKIPRTYLSFRRTCVRLMAAMPLLCGLPPITKASPFPCSQSKCRVSLLEQQRWKKFLDDEKSFTKKISIPSDPAAMLVRHALKYGFTTALPQQPRLKEYENRSSVLCGL